MANSNLKSDPKSVKLEDVGSTLQNPATEETLQDILANQATEETLQSIAGLNIPAFDEQVIDLADPDAISITYKKDSVTVATKSIVTSGTTITITKI